MIAPFYWLPSYDLSTEFHLFKQDFHSRKCNWILKPSQGARGEGHKLFKYEDDALKDIASFLLLNSSERLNFHKCICVNLVQYIESLKFIAYLE